MLSPEERSLRSRIAGLSATAQGKTNTAPARAAFDRRFLNQVDPDGQLPEAERNRRAEAAKKAHFARMAYRSAQARKKRA